ncbi:kinase-like domain-containing protein [Cristinia sonorae]|uniref:Kinase-like domain-containing protein n=1 Tax=Cristinia sonorae TaxID=1940300 RepID=A0A8K0UNV7_9AGAR|nr:kinase-like domain-containing protein [Cristinia sonorae]
MASTSPSNQRPPPRKGTRSHRSNTLQQPSQPNKENHAVEEVVMTDVVSHGDAGTKQINQYVFQHKLGRGQHGEVFVAFDQIKNCEVAIKAVRRKNPKIDRMNQFRKKNLPHSPHTPVTDNLGSTELKIRKEIAIMKKCRHPHVVRLLEVIDDKLSEKIYMVMEYLAGGEIKWRTTSEEPALRVDQTRRICRDVILGLEYLHHQGIIHRDIKPANLLWTADRRMVKIADFGVSHFSAAQYLSSSGQPDIRDPILMDESDLSKFAGTPMFLAPEIISDTSESTAANLDQLGTASTTGTSTTMTKKKQPITKAIDIWAFGVTLYALLFGQLPFKADGEYQIYSVIRTEDWDVPETMGCDCLPVGGRHQESPPSGQETEGFLVVALLQKLLEKDVKKRITLDDVKRHPWIIRDMANADDWLRYTRVGQDSLSPTEHETRSAISSVRFRWSDTRLMKGISSIVKTVRVPRVRRVPSSRLREAAEAKEYKKYKDVGTRSAPQAHMSRHKSTTAVIDGRGKAKEVTSHVEPQPRRQAPRAETSSMASVKSSQTRTSSIVPFSSWAAAHPPPSP